MLSDSQIAKSVKLQPIKTIANAIGLNEDMLEQYGKYKAKIPLDIIDEDAIEKSHLVLVTSINPTPAGEGKTTTSIGLNEGLSKLGKKSIVVLREPSLGPVFGIKGGAAGGGYSQVVPMEEINLHFTGDFSAVEKANNLLSALIDNELHHNQYHLDIDPRTITWKRVMDMNDRALRNITIGLGGVFNGVPREDGFNITPASEVMAILCMATDFGDLKKRLANILVGFNRSKKPVFAKDLQAHESMAILLKDAIKPNLVQTIEGNPAIIHGGPFANIAQGTNTIIATKTGMSLADYVVTEAGFGADLGAEKFLNIKCTQAKIQPKSIVVVATIRALKHHAGIKKEAYSIENVDAVIKGCDNLVRHIENCSKFGIKPLVAINFFPSDTIDEIKAVKDVCEKIGVQAIVAKGFEKGGEGMLELATAIINNETNGNSFTPLYDTEKFSIQEKVARIAREIYRAKDVVYSNTAKKQLKRIDDMGYSHLPVCMAKTQKSFSDDPKKIGVPTDFTIQVQDIEFAIGAGFVVPIVGKMMRMPGLPKQPASTQMFIDDNMNITGLS